MWWKEEKINTIIITIPKNTIELAIQAKEDSKSV